MLSIYDIRLLSVLDFRIVRLRPLPKGIFLPPALFANAHLLLNKLRFAAELKNKNIRFLHAVSSYAKLSVYLS